MIEKDEILQNMLDSTIEDIRRTLTTTEVFKKDKAELLAKYKDKHDEIMIMMANLKFNEIKPITIIQLFSDLYGMSIVEVATYGIYSGEVARDAQDAMEALVAKQEADQGATIN